jgi:signal peptidase II
LIVTRLLRSYWFLFLIAGVIIILDQVSKSYIRANFTEGIEMWAPWDWMIPYARIVYVSNSGVAFGMFQGMGVIFAVLAIIVSLGIVYYFPRVPAEDWPLRLAMGMQLGGALGNLIDRITQNWHVTDFISVGNFPVFNIADASISVGVAVLILGVWLQERREKRRQVSSHERSEIAIDAETPSQDSNASEA